MLTPDELRELIGRCERLAWAERRAKLLRDNLGIYGYRLSEMEKEMKHTQLRIDRLETFHVDSLYARFMNRHRDTLRGAKARLFEVAKEYNALVETNRLATFEYEVLAEKIAATQHFRDELITQTARGMGPAVELFPELAKILRPYEAERQRQQKLEEQITEVERLIEPVRSALLAVDLHLHEAGVVPPGSLNYNSGERRYALQRARAADLTSFSLLRKFLRLTESIGTGSNPSPEQMPLYFPPEDTFNQRFDADWVFAEPIEERRATLRRSLLWLKAYGQQLRLLRQRLDRQSENLEQKLEELIFEELKGRL